jgi:adenosylcobinamide kinase / adenosylcobinamide-phosphate guanylyltransferase
MSLTLVIGGARSGKSRFAENLAHNPKYYIATAQAFDDEMRERIAQHQRQRGEDWTTFDAPLDLVATLKHADNRSNFVLVDCLTLWISNLLLGELDWEVELEQLLMALGAVRGDVVLVSNEVGLGVVPDNALARKFRDAQGITNQAVAELSETVVLLTAGLPLALKGKLPEVQKLRRAR